VNTNIPCTGAVVTGKPLEIGGSKGRAESTGKGVAFCVNFAAEKLGMKINQDTTSPTRGRFMERCLQLIRNE
jgi:glutamate dehydrogenase (NAD(P)+)